MKRLIYYIAALATVAFVGCSQDVEELDTTTSTEKEVRFAVSFDQDTRVALDDTALTWEGDEYLYLCRIDEMSSIGYDNSIRIDNSSISEDKKYAEFYTYNTFVDGAQYVALSKYAWYSSSNSAYSIEINYSSNQSASGSDEHIEEQLLLMSQIFTYDSTQDRLTTLQFTIEQSVLELELKLDSSVMDSYQCSTATISSDNNNFLSSVYLYSDGTIGMKSGSAYDVRSEITTYLGNTPTISSSESYKLYIPVYWADGSTVSGNFKVSLTTTDGTVTTANIAAKELTNGTIYTKSLEFGEAEENTGEKEILLAVYEAMGGSSWQSYYYDYASTWNLDTPLSEWAGINLNGAGYVSYIEFDDITGMTTSLPYDKLAELTSLKCIYIEDCDMPLSLTGISALTNLQEFLVEGVSTFSGTIPDEFYDLTSITGFGFYEVNISGSLSEKISNFTDLTYLYICDTDMSGSIPSSITTLTKLEEVYLFMNQFDGIIPSGLLSMNIDDLDLSFNNFTSYGNSSLYADQELWNRYAKYILTQNAGYGFDDNFRTVYLEESTFNLEDGGYISTSDYFKQNDYTLIVSYNNSYSEAVELFDAAQSAYRAYGSAGLGLVTYNYNTLPSGSVGDVNYNWDSAYQEYTSWSGVYHIIVDSDGKIISNPYITGGYTFDYDAFYDGDMAESSADMMDEALAELFKDADAYFALSVTELSAPSLGGTSTIKVLTNTTWSISESSSWITNVSSTSGSGDKEITITFAQNTTGATRSTTMTFTNGAGDPYILNVTQGVSMLDDFIEEDGL